MTLRDDHPATLAGQKQMSPEAEQTYGTEQMSRVKFFNTLVANGVVLVLEGFRSNLSRCR